MIHSDIPTRPQIDQLLMVRHPASVSLYLPTGRSTLEAQQDRVVLSNLRELVRSKLEAAGVDAGDVAALDESIEAIADDDDFWTRQADSLAVFLTPTTEQTFRLPNQLSQSVEVSDRFHVSPLMRAVTFPQAAHVLALSKGAVRLLEIGPDGAPEEISVADMPRDAWDPRSNKVFKARDRFYVRQVDHAVRSVLNHSDLPLIIAATEGIDALYRTVNTFPHLVDTRWPGNPEELTDAELAANVRTILDAVYADELVDLAELFDVRSSQGRAATDVSDVARLATMGAVDTVLVDFEAELPGSIDEMSGAVTFADTTSAESYGVIDEIARRVHLAGGRVLAVRGDDVPQHGSVAAILRYAP
jgi:hypothetical protein